MALIEFQIHSASKITHTIYTKRNMYWNIHCCSFCSFFINLKPLSPVLLVSHRFSPITGRYFHLWFKSYKSDFFKNDLFGKYKESSDFLKGFYTRFCCIKANTYPILRKETPISFLLRKLKLLENKSLNKKKWEHCPANCYLFKVNSRNTRKNCEICSKLIINTPARRHWRRSSVFIVKFWTCFTPFSCVSIVEFKQVNVCCVFLDNGLLVHTAKLFVGYRKYIGWKIDSHFLTFGFWPQ